MSNSKTLNVRGFKVRSQSKCRYIVVVVVPKAYSYDRAIWDREKGDFATEPATAEAEAYTLKRSNNPITAERAAKAYNFVNNGGTSRQKRFAVVIDSVTDQEV